MQKLPMHTKNIADENFKKLAELFPQAVTEVVGKDENGKAIIERAIDKDVLMAEIAAKVVDGNEQRYQFTWPDKAKAVHAANQPLYKTLRPCREESVNFDDTENLYIEGDNLEVLKLLQENYLGKVKMIYIDPPYNKDKDFVFKDKWNIKEDVFLKSSGLYDDENNHLYNPTQNHETNGRFHTDWLNMIYPRLKLARDLLRDDGIIFISIDDKEVENLKKICNEIFGKANFRNAFITRRYDKNLNRQFMDEGLKSFNVGVEYIVSYSKSDNFLFMPIFKESSEERQESGYWKGFWNDADRPTMRYDILGVTPLSGQWKWKKETALEAVKNYETYIKEYSAHISLEEYWTQTGKNLKFIKRNIKGKGKNMGVENWIPPTTGTLRNSNWSDMLTSKSPDFLKGIFDFPKNIDVLKLAIQASTTVNDIVLDFFSGSASTAHAVMQLNAEDKASRRFIMVQLPEKTPENSNAYKEGYNTICEIGKERIRRAGAKIMEKVAEENKVLTLDFSVLDSSKLDSNATPTKVPDIGFRVLKVDSTNMEHVYYTPKEYSQHMLVGLEENIKRDRTAEDLLFQVMLQLTMPLSSRIKELTMDNTKVFSVDNGYLMACFDTKIDESTVEHIAKQIPFYFVMRDSSIANDSLSTNFEQIFATYSPGTKLKVI